MSAKKYVPNRLRGVLGGDDVDNKVSSSSSRATGRKARPWRMDAAGWKQQLQERKAIYDNFSLHEKGDDEKGPSSKVTTEEKELEAIPLNVLTSTPAGRQGQVDTMLTPNRGGQVETVFTSTSKTSSPSISSSPSLARNDQIVNKRDDEHENSSVSNSSRSSSSSPSKKSAERRPSPLPRNRKKDSSSSGPNRKGKKSPSRTAGASPHRTRRINDFNNSSYSSDDNDDYDERNASKSVDSRDSKEYYIDAAELETSDSKDSNVATVNGGSYIEKQILNNRIFQPKTRAQLLRHGDSHDTAEKIGFPGGEKAESSSDIPHEKSSMEAVEDYVDPSRLNNKCEPTQTRRGGRRQQSPPRTTALQKAMAQSPATSTTSTTHDSSDGQGLEDIVLREHIALSSTPTQKNVEGNAPGSSTENENTPTGEDDNGSVGMSSTARTAVTPDPLQRARKTLLLSNLNRSVRSLMDSSSHSRKEDDELCDSTIENSFSTSIFVPLRSRHQPSTSTGDGSKEIPLNILDDHGVYVSKYDKDAIYVPPQNNLVETEKESSQRDTSQDTFNKLGAYIPQDKAASLSEDTLKYDNAAESDPQRIPDESVSTRPSENETVHSGDDIDNECDKNANEKEDTLENKDQSGDVTPVKEETENGAGSEIENASKHSETEALPHEQPSKSAFGDSKLEGMQGDSDLMHTASENKIQDNTDVSDECDKNGGYDVDEIDANRIRLVSALKRRVGLIYTGNHICVESIGTSEDPDPLATARQKRAAIKAAHNVDLKVQLNDTVSALNTDHHHVVESPGKMKTVKGMKWKERMKKFSKKNGIDISLAKPENKESKKIATEPEEIILATPDTNSDKTDSAYDLHPKATNAKSIEQEGIELAASDTNTNATNIVDNLCEKEKSASNELITKDSEDIDNTTPDTRPDESDSAHDIGESAMKATNISNKIEEEETCPSTKEESWESIDDTQESETPNSASVKLKPETLVGANPDSTDHESNANETLQDAMPKLDVVSTSSDLEAAKERNTSTVDNIIESTAFAVADEREEHITDLPISTDDNNIIQGLPPNKGKKWKDRLRKKKIEKSKKNGAAMDEGASENIRTDTVEHVQETILNSSSNGEDSTNSKNSESRPSFTRNLSDLTAEEKKGVVPPEDEAQIEPAANNGGKKSNKWKNRLARIKGSKQDNAKPSQAEVKPESPISSSDRGQILVDFKSPNMSPVKKTELSPATSDRGQILVDFKRPDLSPADRGQILVDFKRQDLSPLGTSDPIFNDKQKSMEAWQTPEYLRKADVPISAEKRTEPNLHENTKEVLLKAQISSQNGSKMQDSNVRQNLRQSFQAFDAFLKNGQNPTDEESIYTEMTIEQTVLEETVIEEDLPAAHFTTEEELSYMDITIDESLMEQNEVSKSLPKDEMKSPFISNLRTRMFQNAAPSIPKLSMPKEQKEPEKPSKTIRSPDENLKKFPTITVGDAFDDDMTQITMGSLDLDHHDEKENNDDETFFDAESRVAPSAKSIGKESTTSNSSQKACSATSKQRIAEILRKEVWSRDNSVVQKAMEELDNEAKNGYNHRAHIVRCGGVMTIMRAMEMNSSSEGIQIASCSTLEKLALDAQTQIAICEMEGISLIVRSMQVHFEDVPLQETACVALATICRHQEASTSKDLMKDAEEAIPTLLSCMTRYPTHSCIQAKGFQAIANLCSGSHAHQRLEELSRAGGIMTMTMALQAPWENKNDQHEAISNLSILLRGITELNAKPSSVDAKEVISKDMKQDGMSGTRNEPVPVAHEQMNYVGPSADNATVASYMEDIPDMSMMSTVPVVGEEIPSHVQYHGEEIPDLDQFPTMMSNVEWQNFGEDDLDAGRKTTSDPISPANAGTQRQGRKGDGEEQCIIQ